MLLFTYDYSYLWLLFTNKWFSMELDLTITYDGSNNISMNL